MKQATAIRSENEPDTHRDMVHQVLLDFLDQDNSLSRCCTVQALTKLGATDDKTQQRLIELLRDPDPDVRIETAYALGELKRTDAIEALVYNLENDPEGDVRIQAVTALAKIASDQTLASQILTPLIRCLEQDGYPQLDHITDDMESPCSYEVQSQALNALGELGDPHSIAPIIKLLENDEYEYLQEQGFRVLTQIDNEQALSFLLKQLKQGGCLARRRAARALSNTTIFLTPDQIEDQEFPMEVLTALSYALGDSDPGVRLYVARALSHTRNPLVSAPLILLLNDPDPEVRQGVAELLGKMRGHDIVDHLHTLLSKANGKHKASIAHILGEIGDPDSVEILAALLDTDDSDLLYEVVWALGECRLPAPKMQLATILANEKNDPTVRIQAAQSLSKLLNHKAPTELKPVKENTSGNDMNDDPRDVLIKAIHDKHVGVSYAALDALVEINPEAAQQMLIDLIYTAPSTEEKEIQDVDTGTTTTVEELVEQKSELVQQFNLDASPENSTVAAILAASSTEPPVDSDQTHETPDNEEPVTDKQENNGLRQSKPSPHERIQVLATRLLGNSKKPNAEIIDALICCTEHENIALRCEALRALGRIKTDRALPAIQQALKSRQRDSKLAALEALGRFDVAALKGIEFEHLHSDPDADVRRIAMQIMLSIDSPKTREHICQAMKDENIEVCRTALNASAHTRHHPEYTDLTIDLMFGFSGELRKAAAATLRQTGNFAPASRLLKILVDPESEEYHWVCIDALAEMYAAKPNHFINPDTIYAK